MFKKKDFYLIMFYYFILCFIGERANSTEPEFLVEIYYFGPIPQISCSPLF